MKKGIITMMMLMLGMSSMMAQKTLVVAGAGDVTLKQGETLEIKCDGSPLTFTKEGAIMLTSFKDYDVTIPDLRSLKVTGAGDVESKGKLNFPNLDIVISGTGDADLDIECDTLVALITGVGDLKLKGHCHYLEATISGLGDLDFDNFVADSLAISKNKRGKSSWDWDFSQSSIGRRIYKNLLFDPNWEGVDAGLNMLLGENPNATFPADYTLLEQRALKSWNFNFNLAGVGVAFTRTHSVGMYTGIGLGWNNYSFNMPTRLEKGTNKLICYAIDEAEEGVVDRSKLGVLYLQAPLMVEVRPTRHFFVALGVTAGIRVDAWTKIKFDQDDTAIKTHSDYYINRFKLDASLRAGGTESLGFFANYNLLPLFVKDKGPEAHCLSFGMSLNF